MKNRSDKNGIKAPSTGMNKDGKISVAALDLQAIYIQPTLRLKLTDNIGIGGGLVYALGKVDRKRALPNGFIKAINDKYGSSTP